jgi:GH25 family lysozyme M1 (1,4-beta-N-acetylmuramidase)
MAHELAVRLIAAVALSAAMAGAARADMVSAVVDISEFNDAAAVVAQAKASGLSLVFHRATLGTGTPDKSFVAGYRTIRTARLAAGAYHVIFPPRDASGLATTGAEQAGAFLEQVTRACRPGESVLLAVDWEPPHRDGQLIAPAPASVLRDFIVEVQRITGKTPVVYTDRSTIEANRSGIDQTIRQAPLWFAFMHYPVRYSFEQIQIRSAVADKTDRNKVTLELAPPEHDTVTFPQPDQIQPWARPTFWQFSPGGGFMWNAVRMYEPDIQNVDTDYFIGTRRQLAQFIAANSWKCTAYAPKPAPAPGTPVAPG